MMLEVLDFAPVGSITDGAGFDAVIPDGGRGRRKALDMESAYPYGRIVRVKPRKTAKDMGHSLSADLLVAGASRVGGGA